MPVTTEGDPIMVVSARWRVRRELALEALRRCEQCLDDGGGSFTWIAARERLVAMQPDPMPRGAALVETSVIDIPGAVSLGELSLKRSTLRYEGLSERRLGVEIVLAEGLRRSSCSAASSSRRVRRPSSRAVSWAMRCPQACSGMVPCSKAWK